MTSRSIYSSTRFQTWVRTNVPQVFTGDDDDDSGFMFNGTILLNQPQRLQRDWTEFIVTVW